MNASIELGEHVGCVVGEQSGSASTTSSASTAAGPSTVVSTPLRAELVEVELADPAVPPDLLVGRRDGQRRRSAAARRISAQSGQGPPAARTASGVNAGTTAILRTRAAIPYGRRRNWSAAVRGVRPRTAVGSAARCQRLRPKMRLNTFGRPCACSASTSALITCAGVVQDVLGLVEDRRRRPVVEAGRLGRGGRDTGCRGSRPRRQPALEARAALGQRHGASGARSRLHFRTVSPFGYVRLSKFLHSVRIGIVREYRQRHPSWLT